jgi:hypothetical protein
MALLMDQDQAYSRAGIQLSVFCRRFSPAKFPALWTRTTFLSQLFQPSAKK